MTLKSAPAQILIADTVDDLPTGVNWLRDGQRALVLSEETERVWVNGRWAYAFELLAPNAPSADETATWDGTDTTWSTN